MKNLFKIRLFDLSEKNERKVLLFIFIVTVIFRAIFVYYTYTKTGKETWVDDYYYLNAAEQIAKGNWNIQYRESDFLIVGPSLPLLDAIFIKAFGNAVIPFFIYNIIVTSIMVPVLYYLGKEVFSKRLGWFLAIWGVFFIEAYKYSSHILKEATLLLFLPLTLLFIIRAIKWGNQFIKNLIFASLSFTWLIHTDERYFIYLPFFALFFFLIKPFKLSASTKSATFWIICVFLLMLPWGIRNYMVFDQIVILSPRTTAITSKIWGNNLAEKSSHFSDNESKQILIESRQGRATRFGKQYNISPREYEKCEARFRAFINFWQPTYFKPKFIQHGYRPQKWSLKHNLVSILFYGIFLPFYIISLFIFIKRKQYLLLAISTIPIIHSLLHAYMVWPLERYRSPITFIIVMLGSYIILELIEKNKKENTRILSKD